MSASRRLHPFLRHCCCLCSSVLDDPDLLLLLQLLCSCMSPSPTVKTVSSCCISLFPGSRNAFSVVIPQLQNEMITPLLFFLLPLAQSELLELRQPISELAFRGSGAMLG